MTKNIVRYAVITNKNKYVIVDTNDGDREILIHGGDPAVTSIYDICDLLNQEYRFYSEER